MRLVIIVLANPSAIFLYWAPFSYIHNQIPMMNKDEMLIMRAISLCYKPFMKPEEACIYTNLGRTQLAKRCEEFGVTKTATGYYNREELDKMMAGEIRPLAVGSINQRIAEFKRQIRGR